MPLAYYSVAATREFWTEHWGGHSADALLRIARESPLTALITSALPAGGVVLEAGCGLGQYVRLLREGGWHAAGVDLSLEALRAGRAADPTAPLVRGDLQQLGVRGDAVDAYVSLGVVEHDPGGPDAILGEARRVLRRGGVLVVSVPYVNGVRRAALWWLRHRNRRIRDAGGEFYQFAFSRGEAAAFVERNGFRVVRATPYDPARVLRKGLRTVRRLVPPGAAARARDPGPAGVRPEAGQGPRGLRRAVRRLLYTGPALRAFGHMILLVAVKR